MVRDNRGPRISTDISGRQGVISSQICVRTIPRVTQLAVAIVCPNTGIRFPRAATSGWVSNRFGHFKVVRVGVLMHGDGGVHVGDLLDEFCVIGVHEYATDALVVDCSKLSDYDPLIDVIWQVQDVDDVGVHGAPLQQ